MKVAFVSSEVVPFSKTGGMADVSAALPKALKTLDVEVKVFTPKYGKFLDKNLKLKIIKNFPSTEILINGNTKNVKYFSSTLPHSNVEVILIENEFYFGRDNIYTTDPDEGERFIFFQKAVLEFLKQTDWIPDLIHLNDWQTALIPYYIKEKYPVFRSSASLLTLHNVAYQGIFPPDILPVADVDEKLFFPTGPAEYYGNFNFLKMGIFFSDVINTVSPTYAKEILTEEFGAGLEGILNERKNDLVGILNGVDYKEWDPASDPLIFENYNSTSLELKTENKIGLCKEIKMRYRKTFPLVGFISRLTEQKGIDLLIEILPELLKLKACFVILGAGEKKYEEQLLEFGKRYSSKLKVIIGYDNTLAHKIEAGADIFLMPSRFEPCGLNQIYSLKYGTAPVVRATGGLRDTVIPYNGNDSNSLRNADGFAFDDYSATQFLKTVQFAVSTYKQKGVWKKLQLNGMSRDFSWDVSAAKYKELYEKAIRQKREV